MNSLVNITTEAGVSRRQSRRDHVERLLDLATHLADADRVLIEQVYRHGVPIVDIARLSGQQPRRLQRRVSRLLKHMNSPLFSFVLGYAELLPTVVRRTAELVILRGHSLRSASIRSGQTLHQIRQHIRTVRALARV